MNPQERLIQILGKAILFVGAECKTWQQSDFVNCAIRARSLNYDTICCKVGEGTYQWFSDAQLLAIYQAVTKQGVGFAPFWFMVGPKFGLSFVPREAASMQHVIEVMASASGHEGYIIGDPEIDWDHRADAASAFTQYMLGKPGLLGITTWGNPTAHGWHTNIDIMKTCCNMWIPQEYNDYLAIASNDDMVFVQPALDLSPEFGVNHPVDIAARYKAQGARCFFQWEYGFISAYRSNALAINAIAKR